MKSFVDSKTISYLRKTTAWLITVMLVFLNIPLSGFADPDSYDTSEETVSEERTYHLVTFTAANPNISFSIHASGLATPADYEATESNATEADAESAAATESSAAEEISATPNNTNEDGSLPDGEVTDDGTGTVASDSDPEMSGLSSVTVFVHDGECLTDDQIPSVSSASKYIGVKGWKDEEGYWYENAGLLSACITRDVTFTANTYSTRLKRLFAAGTVCVIGTTEYQTLDAAVTAAVTGDTIQMVVASYDMPSLATSVSGKSITITTDTSTTPGGVQCVLQRVSAAATALFSVPSGAGLTLSGITLDGGLKSTPAVTGGSYLIGNSGTVTLENGAVLQNNYSSLSTNTAGAIYSSGTVNIEEGSRITGCSAQYGGAISCYGSGIINMTGGSLDHCYSRRAASDTGSAVHCWGTSVFNMSGGTITGCGSLGSTQAGGGAVEMEAGTANLSGGSITGNTGKGTAGGVNNYNGTVNLSGSITIKDNYGTCTYDSSGNVLTKGALCNLYNRPGVAYLKVTGNLTGSVGITSAVSGSMAGTAQFATAATSPASGYTGLNRLLADTNTGSSSDLFGAGSTYDKKISWYGKKICKIGNTGFYSISEALAAITSGVATDISGNTGTDKTDYKIEMLAEEIPVTAALAVPSGKNIMMTTADAGTGDLDYSGASGTFSKLMRSPAYTGTICTVPSGSSLTMKNITLDGGWKSDHSGTKAASYLIGATGTFFLQDGATLQNNYSSAASETAGAVYAHGGTVNISGTAKITNCEAEYGGGVSIYGGTLNMSGGSIDHCYAFRDRLDSAGGVESWAGGKINMSGGSITDCASLTFTGNGGGAIVQEDSNCTADFSGGTISGNTGAGKGGGVYAVSGSVSVSGSTVITGNKCSCTYDSYTPSGGTSSNLCMAGGAFFTTAGSLTGSVGVTSAGHMSSGDQFSVSSTALSSSLSGLENYFADTNNGTSDLVGAAGTDNKVVWKKAGTCQIIRNVSGAAAFAGIYPTIAEACAAAQSGDIIEVFRSHEETATSEIPATVTGLVIRTAPAAVPTATGAKVFEPKTGETDTATVTRAATLTGSSMISVNGRSAASDHIIFDGNGSSCAASTPLISVSGSTSSLSLFAGTVVQNSSNTGNTSASYGTVNVSGGAALTLDGSTFRENRADRGSAVYANGSSVITITGDSNITGNTATAAKGGAVTTENTTSGAVVLSGSPSVNGNTDGNNSASNIRLPAAPDTDAANGSQSVIRVNGILSCDDGALGVTVDEVNHHSGWKFVRNFDDGGTASTATASANLPKFRDDLSTEMNIGANRETANNVADYDTYLYFIPPTRLQFTKESDGDSHATISDASFHIYKWVGTGDIPETYESETAMQSDSDWSRVTYMTQSDTPDSAKGNEFTSDENGNTDCGFLDDKSYRIIETATPDFYSLPAGEWNIKVDSSVSGPGKIAFTTVCNGTRNIDTDYTYDFKTDGTGYTPYYLYNYSKGSTLTLKYVNIREAYADLTKKGKFAVTYTDLSGNARTVNAEIENGGSYLLGGIRPGSIVTVAHTDTGGYTVTQTTVAVPAGETVDASGTAGTAWTYSALRGDTVLRITNDKKTVVPTGICTDDISYRCLIFLLAGLLAVLCTGFIRKRSRI